MPFIGEQLRELIDNGGGGSGQPLYRHCIKVYESGADLYEIFLQIVSTSASPVNTEEQFRAALGEGEHPCICSGTFNLDGALYRACAIFKYNGEYYIYTDANLEGSYIPLFGNIYYDLSISDTVTPIGTASVGGGSCVITDLGYQAGHQPAEDTILGLLKPTSVPTGGYIYTYWTDCASDACLAICYKDEWSIMATQYTSGGEYRKFYYSFEEDTVVEHQCVRAFGVEVAEELGNQSGVAISQWAVTEALKQVGGGIPFVPRGNITVIQGATNLATKWYVANVGGITTPTDGMTIAIRTQDNSSYGILLSIDGGSNYYPIVRNQNTRVGTEYPKNCTLILTFNATQTSSVYLTGSSTQTTVTGCWQVADFDTNNFVTQFHTNKDDKYPLMFMYRSGVTSTGITSSYTQYSNNIYANPSTGAIYANDFIVSGQSLDQRLQAVENLLSGVGVAEDGEF